MKDLISSLNNVGYFFDNLEFLNLFEIGKILYQIKYFISPLDSLFESIFETINIKNMLLNNLSVKQAAFFLTYSSMILFNLTMKNILVTGYIFSFTLADQISFNYTYAFDLQTEGIFSIKSSDTTLTNFKILNNILITNLNSMIYVTGISNYFSLTSSNISYCSNEQNGGVIK